MKAQKILSKVLNYWPTEIDTSDGIVLSETNGFKSENLTQSWNYAEQKAKGNDWDEIAVWVIYGLLHKIAKTDFMKGIYKIYPIKIQIEDFKKKLFDELQNETYKTMLSEYIKLNE